MKTNIILLVMMIFSMSLFAQTELKVINHNTDSVVKKEVVEKQAVVANKNVKIISVQNDSIIALHKRIHEAVSKDFYNGVLPVHYMIAFFFAFIGMFIRWSFSMGKKIQDNTNPQMKFSWLLWLQGTLHKVMRVIATLALVFVFLRFSNEILGFAFSMFVALLIGFFIDFLADKFLSLKPETIFKKVITDNTNPTV